MKTVYLLIGLPGVGKSTFAKNSLPNAAIVELDETRQHLSDNGVIGREYKTSDNEIVFKYFHEAILNAIDFADEVVVDATNARLSEREDIYNLLSSFKPKFVAINFNDSKELAVKRIKERQAKNPNCVHVFKNPEQAVDIYAARIAEGKTTLDEPLAEIWEVKNGNVINKHQKILIASTNHGKILIYNQMCTELGLKATNLHEIKIDDKIKETGKNETENAIIKAVAYHNITGLPVIANDSGLVIDRFKKEDQPGVLVRRYKGSELTDKELLNVYIQKLNEVGGESTGHYNVSLALIDFDGNLHTKEFKPKRYFINVPSKTLVSGIPLSSLSFDKESGKYLSEMSPKEMNEYEGPANRAQRDFIESVFLEKENNK